MRSLRPLLTTAAAVLLTAMIIGRVTIAISAEPSAAALDEYGGYRELPLLRKPTGYFRVEKLSDRWVFITPTGNAFWLRAVYGIDITDGGAKFVENLKRKYQEPTHIPWWQYVRHAAQRLKEYGFNALGEYTSPYAFPIPTYGRITANSEKLPFIRMINAILYARPWFEIKDVMAGVDPVVTPGLWRSGGFPDVFDPALERAAQDIARSREVFPKLETLTTSPWLIGATMDDRDYLFGFGPMRELGGWHNHVGWLVATTSPTQTFNSNIRRGATKGLTYTDPRVYSKYAFRDFLKEKYRTLAALNTAWTSRYTAWDSDGGWPNGTGVLDESGRSSWLGKDFYSLRDTHPTVRTDLDEWFGRIADKYFSVVAGAIRRVDPNHLVFSPAAISMRAHPAVLKAAGRHCDVLQVEGASDSDATFERAYSLARRPMFVWTTFMAHNDSPLARSKLNGWDSVNFSTQEARGAAYAAFVKRLVRFRASDGSYPFVGVDWWAYTDKVTGGESNNFGLVSNRDNAYDGKHAVIAIGRDAAGYPYGGEDNNYGDFLTSVSQANHEIRAILGTQLRRLDPRDDRQR